MGEDCIHLAEVAAVSFFCNSSSFSVVRIETVAFTPDSFTLDNLQSNTTYYPTVRAVSTVVAVCTSTAEMLATPSAVLKLRMTF
ncbi:unnamed protein product [Hydatigera taeniaeformis]|uniref:Secreted protein n=1 Tax=Hydatigena taeniaeformis TaxID=6205 RepID=A0A0R3X4V9_HYDTA|nr:unnamed protein product [Hydatigera taeniaeformis]